MNFMQSLSNILLSRLNPYVDEIIGDLQCLFRRNRSTTDHMFCIRQILEKKWEYNETVHQLVVDFKKAYDSVRREINLRHEDVWGSGCIDPHFLDLDTSWR
jgi:hypothetical protein